MKKCLKVLVVAFFLFFCGVASALTATQWQSASQTTKNNAIATAAANSLRAWNSSLYDANQGNCFAWASSVVVTASGGARSLPWATMQPNPNVPVTQNATLDSWYWKPTTSTPALVNAFPGHVVQMNLKSGSSIIIPHTAIYMGYSGSTLYFINANFPSNKVSGTIPPAFNNGVLFTNANTFTWSFSYFNATVRDYTINIIH